MNENEMKDMWEAYNQKLNQHMALNYHMMHSFKVDKSKSALRRFTFGKVLSLILGHIVNIYLIYYVIIHFFEPHLSIPGIISLILNALALVWNTYQISLLSELDYNKPILEIQQRIQKIRLHKLRYNRYIFVVSFPLFWLGLIILFHINVIAVWNHLQLYLVIHIVLAIAWFPFAFWWLRKMDDPSLVSTRWKKLKDDSSLTPNSVSTAINEALNFLEELESFKKDL